MSVRIQAIRGNRAAIEFRGFPPKARDDLVNALGDKITVQESNWNCALFFTSNHARKPYDDRGYAARSPSRSTAGAARSTSRRSRS